MTVAFARLLCAARVCACSDELCGASARHHRRGRNGEGRAQGTAEGFQAKPFGKLKVGDWNLPLHFNLGKRFPYNDKALALSRMRSTARILSGVCFGRGQPEAPVA
jgi:hypothetical protein